MFFITQPSQGGLHSTLSSSFYLFVMVDPQQAYYQGRLGVQACKKFALGGRKILFDKSDKC